MPKLVSACLGPSSQLLLFGDPGELRIAEVFRELGVIRGQVIDQPVGR